MKTLTRVQQRDSTDSGVIPRLAWQSRQFLLEGALVLLLILATASLALIARQYMPAYQVDLTVPQVNPRLHLVGMHALEQNEQFTYHWSSDYSFVQLLWGYHAAPRYRAAVRLQAAHPQEPQLLTFLANERALTTVLPATSFRTYHLLLAADTPADTSVRFALQTTPFSPPGDPRELGVIMTGITLQPLPYHDLSVALLLASAIPVLWGWLRWRGMSLRAALLLCGVLTATLLLLYALYRPAPLRYVWLAGMALAASAVAVPLARETASRLGLALLAILVSFSGMLWPSWISDDAFISFRYAQNLVAGHGLVYNVGERVEGYTNFLWTMLAALVLAFDRDPVFWSYVAGGLLAPAILLVSYTLARRLLGPAWALVAALFVATSQSLLVYTARGAGLETGLFTLLALGSSAFYLHSAAGTRRTYAVLTGLGFALTSLTRPEGVLLMGLTVGHLLVRHLQLPVGNSGDRKILSRIRLSIPPRLLVRRLALVLGAYLLVFGPYFLWRVTYYGDLLPNTFYAKTGGGMQQLVRGLAYAGEFALAFGGPLLLLLLLLPARQGWAALRGWRGYMLLLVSVYSLYIMTVGGDHFPGERFFVPLTPWLALLLADGLAEGYAWCRRQKLLQRLAPAGLALLLLLYAPYALLRSMTFDTVLAGNDESVWIWRELGWWLQDHTAPDASVAALGAGAIAYYSDRTTIDLLGLNDRHIARVAVADMGAGTAGHEKRDPEYVLNERQPTYIPRMWDGYFGGEQGLRGQYNLITIQTRYGRELELWERRP
ncbi:MAG: hypothetical protein ACLFVO_27325 [Chloroflexaceae bacterium]